MGLGEVSASQFFTSMVKGGTFLSVTLVTSYIFQARKTVDGSWSDEVDSKDFGYKRNPDIRWRWSADVEREEFSDTQLILC